MLAILSQASYTLTVVIKNDNSSLCSSTAVPLMRRKREERMDHSQAIDATTMQTPTQVSYSLWQLVRYFLRLGTLGFGGPVALVGYMQRDLVEQRAWIAESDYKEGLALAQLCPGPLAAQLAMYLGYVRYRMLGATLVGLGLYLAVVSDGGCSRLALYALRWPSLDAGRVLRSRRQRDRHCRPQRLEADEQNHWT